MVYGKMRLLFLLCVQAITEQQVAVRQIILGRN